MEWNPILIRESRARWRGWRGFALVLGYTALLAAMMAAFYGEAAGNAWGQADNGQRSSRLGADMFMHLAWMQALGWMLMAPALTASAIAGERENGLLEALHLAPLSPLRIVLGKMWAVALFVFLILVVALPPVAICFLLGGVSPGEFFAATGLHAATALFCGAIGLFCSAWSRRAGNAMRVAFTTVILWGIGSATATGLSFIPVASFNWHGWPVLLRLFGLTNPVYSALALTSDEVASIGGPTGIAWFLDIPPWSVSPLAQLVFGVLLLMLAARPLRRPLPELSWAGESTPSSAEAAPPATSTPAGSTPAALPIRKPVRIWRTLPVAEWVSSSNPVLQRELRGKFKMREPSAWTLVTALLALCGLLYGYISLWWEAWSGPYSREGIWWGLMFVGLFLLIVMCAVAGASAFTREREAGTWEPLGLSQLNNFEIIWGKVLPPILSAVAYSALAWPLLLPAILPSGQDSQGIPLPIAAASVLILLASAWNLTAFGMFVSWQCRRTAASTGWVIGVLFCAYLLGPIVLAVVGGSADGMEVLMALWHPFVALALVADGPDNARELAFSLLTATSLFGIGCFWLGLLHGAMRDGVRERDNRRSNRQHLAH